MHRGEGGLEGGLRGGEHCSPLAVRGKHNSVGEGPDHSYGKGSVGPKVSHTIGTLAFGNPHRAQGLSHLFLIGRKTRI